MERSRNGSASHAILRSYSRRSCSSSINPRFYSASQAHTPFDRGVAAVEAMMGGLKDFYNDHSTLHNMMNRHLNCINPLLSTLPRSSRTFIRAALQRWRFLSLTIQDWQNTEPWLSSVTADEPMVGKVGKDLGAHVIRCSENHLNVEDKGTMKVLHDIVCRPLGFLAVWPMVTMADT